MNIPGPRTLTSLVVFTLSDSLRPAANRHCRSDTSKHHAICLFLYSRLARPPVAFSATMPAATSSSRSRPSPPSSPPRPSRLRLDAAAQHTHSTQAVLQTRRFGLGLAAPEPLGGDAHFGGETRRIQVVMAIWAHEQPAGMRRPIVRGHCRIDSALALHYM
ncbi:hypothetical protein MSAN_00654200 [Mycena sanguinolenta]|uniref:Uncharacterized protein n=1 Tax=Mycena sanguinolenta TaxID=230812 RepID=A0A8H6Z473_9AGAR|nr:hypothetical protein MSAN_00654200 [Mycena sanguinolenta]